MTALLPVTVKWLNIGKTQDLQFHARIFAMHQHPDGSLEPRTGWAIIIIVPSRLFIVEREMLDRNASVRWFQSRILNIRLSAVSKLSMAQLVVTHPCQ
jgi:hypothetical protein